MTLVLFTFKGKFWKLLRYEIIASACVCSSLLLGVVTHRKLKILTTLRVGGVLLCFTMCVTFLMSICTTFSHIFYWWLLTSILLSRHLLFRGHDKLLSLWIYILCHYETLYNCFNFIYVYISRWSRLKN